MPRTLLLLGLMLGVVAGSGAAEAQAAAVLDAVSSATTPDPSFMPVGLKRHGFHRSAG